MKKITSHNFCKLFIMEQYLPLNSSRNYKNILQIFIYYMQWYWLIWNSSFPAYLRYTELLFKAVESLILSEINNAFCIKEAECLFVIQCWFSFHKSKNMAYRYELSWDSQNISCVLFVISREILLYWIYGKRWKISKKGEKYLSHTETHSLIHTLSHTTCFLLY